MEPRDRAARSLTRLRLAATCVLLTGLVFVQDPGLIVADTKLDLVLDPGRFLGRATQLWDATSAFGQLQNQAYGYLWPMGPFFWLGDLLGSPGWAVQRAWWAVVVCTAFVGAALVARALGVRRDLAVVAAGLAYALSPRLLTVLGPISIEGWPSALAPWVLLPLVVGSRRGSPRVAAGLSAVAVAMVGGVNAAATFAVLPLGAVWLLTRERGPRRTALLVWWPVLTLLGTLWWLIPLFTLGAYSPPFLDFIESATVTTFPTTLFDALRGTSNWVPYVSGDSRAGNDLLTQGWVAAMSGVVLLVGLAGLLDRRQPHRWFLALSVVVGLAMVTAGHLGQVQGLFAGGLHAALDGALAPLRNVHKFDPVVRLPLAVGLGWALQRLLEARVRERDPGARLGRVDRAVALGVVLLAVALASSPALTARVAPGGAFLAVPDYWRETAAWLERADEGGGRALLVPGTSFGDYVWGDPHDEPMQALARSEWAVRNQIPLSPPGGIRALDRIEQELATGQGSTALTEALRRAGVRWLVARNDLRPADGVPDPVVVRQALEDSPGIVLDERIGPEVGGEAHFYDDDEQRLVVNGGRQARVSAVEIWRVDAPRDPVTTTPEPTVVVGGPEDLLDLERLDVLGGGAAVLAPDVEVDSGGGPAGVAAGARVVLTDGLRERERSFARITDGDSPVLLPGDVRRTGNPSADYLTADMRDWLTTGALAGVREITASSSASDATAAGGSQRGRLPYAALDGDPTTQWSGDRAQTGPDAWSVRFTSPREPGTVQLLGGRAADPRQQVRVETPRWSSDPVALGPGERAQVPVDLGGGATATLSVVQAGAPRSPMALAEVQVDGVKAVRRLDLPRLPRGWGAPDVVALRADLDPRQGCVEVSGDLRCSSSQVRSGEEDAGLARRLTLPEGADYEPELRVRPRPGPGLAAVLAGAQPVAVSASSTAVPDPRAAAVAIVDGTDATTWIATPDDLRPTLRLGWLRPQRLTGVRVQLSDDAPASRPVALRLVWPRGSIEVELDERGEAELPDVRTRQLRVEITGVDQAFDLDFDTTGAPLPPGVGELELEGADLLPLTASTQVQTRPCGTGPEVRVEDVAYRTSVRASDAQLLAGERVPAALCAPEDGPAPETLTLATGITDIAATPSAAYELSSLVLRRPGSEPGASEVAAESGDGLLARRHNANPGWVAEQGGAALTPVVVDGWRQGWAQADPADAGPVTTRFGPQAAYSLGLAVGAAALLLLVATLLLGRRGGRHVGEGPAPVAGRSPGPVAAAVTGLVVALVLAGWPGLLVGAAVTAVVLPLARRWPVVGPLLPALAVALAAAAYWQRPWGGLDAWAGNLAWPAYLALVPVVAVVALSGRALPGRTPRSRSAGRSTTR